MKPMVIDGEIVPFQNNRPLSFQALQRRLRKLIPSSDDVPVKYFAFDLLYHERPIIEEPLSERVRLLHSLDFQDPLGFSMQKPVSTVEEIQGMFDESKNLGYEGLVVKSPESPYSPGRRGKSWIKLKKELRHPGRRHCRRGIRAWKKSGSNFRLHFCSKRHKRIESGGKGILWVNGCGNQRNDSTFERHHYTGFWIPEICKATSCSGSRF